MFNSKLNIYFFYLILSACILCTQNINSDWFQKLPIHQWANGIGDDIRKAGFQITKKDELEQAYRNEEIEPINGFETIGYMSTLLGKLLESKINALIKIVEKAENESLKPIDVSDKESFTFKNAKNLTSPYNESLTGNSHFFNIPVNTSFSVVHVPTYTYECANDSMRDILWSENLDPVFIRNYDNNLTLSWQYFGAVSGITRLYPGMNWTKGSEPVDLYDSRMQPWYIVAASSPKDVMILIDNSGSMIGQKQKIARNAVNTILETLSPNDFVNVLSFGDKVKEVVSCFNTTLVQANLENIQELKMGVKGIMSEANGIANFSEALTQAFDILGKVNNHHKDMKAAMCNQAIMLITDGAYENYKSIFEKYNWKNSTHKPFPVRVFTFGIGGNGDNNRQIVWMACANQGYYVQINTITEVREQVLKYINVMARPLVLENVHFTSWTSLYAHIVDPKLSSWLWKQEENGMQKEYSLAYINFLNSSKKNMLILPNFRIDRIQDYDQGINSDNFPYNLTTSVSLPAYDRRNLSENVPNLLGVAATDIPITVFRDALDSYTLGVNNYGFIVDNNGYVIIHPDLRPVTSCIYTKSGIRSVIMKLPRSLKSGFSDWSQSPYFQGILKPRYNNIDISEVEMLDDNSAIRNFSSDIIEFRDLIINQSSTKIRLFMKYHYDNMRRVSSCPRTYYMNKVDDSPFTAVIGISDHSEYRIKQPAAANVRLSEKVLSYFGNDSWDVHPNWFYCRNDISRSPKEEITNVLALLKAARWKWPDNSLQKYTFVGNATRCNKELVQALLYDANITKNLLTDMSSLWKLIERYEVVNVFVATRSGLTRWYTTTNGQMYPSFESTNKKSIDEIWYKRAVEQQNSFVFWFNSSDIQYKPMNEDTLITASYAIMVKKGQQKAAAAVVGFRFKQSALQQLFQNHSTRFSTKRTIQNLPASYYILDHNGYILVSEDRMHTGKFFGAVYGSIMQSLVKQNVYKEVPMYDYQAVCFNETRNSDTSNACRLLAQPIKHLFNLINWLAGSLVWWLAHINLQWVMAIIQGPPTPIVINVEYGEEGKERKRRVKKLVTLNRTYIVPCDQTVNLYELITETKYTNATRIVEIADSFRASRIQHTNLLLVIIKETRSSDKNFDTIPRKHEYNGFSSPACYKVQHNWFSRRRVKYCKKEHDKEKLLELCGNTNMNTSSSILMVLSLLSAMMASHL